MKKAVKRRSPSSPRDMRTRPSLRDLAYEKIKHEIISLKVKPGEYLNEVQLSTRLRIGRTPVHQALDRLMIEGMVEIMPRKGVIVKPVSLHEVMQLIEVRLLNETYCARLAAERASEQEIDTFTRILASSHNAARTMDIERMMLLDREFHLLIAQTARNDILGNLLGKLHDRSLRFWFISLTKRDHHRNVQDEHMTIFKAIRSHDSDAAANAMRYHIESFRRNLANYI